MFKLTSEGERKFSELNKRLEVTPTENWLMQDIMDWTILSLVNEGINLQSSGPEGRITGLKSESQDQMIRRQLLRSYHQGWIEE